MMGADKTRTKDDLVATEFAFKDDFYSDDMMIRVVHPKITRMISPFYAGEKWAVVQMDLCLNKQSKWEPTPLGSMRDQAFYARCRFDTIEDAIAAFEKNKEMKKS